MTLLRTISLFLFISFTSLAHAGQGVYNNFEDALRNKKDVRVLRLTYKSLEELPDVFDQIPNLEELNVNNNNISKLPPTLYT